VLTIMAAALLLQIVDSYAVQTAARGAAIVTVDALNMVLVAVLVFLFMRQVMPIAAGLAGGTAFNTFGTVSRAATWSARVGMDAMRRGARTTAALLARDRV
jgi:type IV secretion system protein VirB6